MQRLDLHGIGQQARERRRVRRLAVVVLLFQALLWIAGPTVEARAEARAAGATAHVEDEGATRCPPIHSHLDCQICRTLRTSATAGLAPALWRTTDDARGRWSGPSVTPRQATPHGPLGSRAPPTR